MRIGQVLVEKGVITPEQLEEALRRQHDEGGLVGDVLLSMRRVDEETLARVLADEASVPYVRLESPPDRDALSRVPAAFARDRMLLPLALRGATLRVAQANPFDVLALDDLRRLTGCAIEAACTTRSALAHALDTAYTGGAAIAELARAAVASLARPPAAPPSEETPLVRLIEALLADAVERGATELRIEPAEQEVTVRCRVDGVLVAGDPLPKALQPALVTRIKLMSGLDIADTRLPQDGRLTGFGPAGTVDARVATCPSVFGDQVAIRMLATGPLRDLADLGLSRRSLDLVRGLLERSRGVLLVAGPAGAGRTTTLYSALSVLSTRQTNILTVEDTVERRLASIRQTEVRPKARLTFPAAIRSTLRQGPDAIMIDEILDAETAHLALRAALSGVLVLGAVRAPDAAATVPRLLDMGLEPGLLASGTAGIVAQRLLRLVCRECRAPASYAPAMLVRAGLAGDGPVTLVRGRGCRACNGTGYRGRTGVFEVLVVTDPIRDLVRACADAGMIRQAAARAGMPTLLDAAATKAIFGLTSLDEVLRLAGE